MGNSARTDSYAISNWNLNFLLEKRRLMSIVVHKTSNRFWLKSDCCCRGDWLEKSNPTSAQVTINVRVLLELGKGRKVFLALLCHRGADWFNALGHGKLPCLTAPERSHLQWFTLIYKNQIPKCKWKKTQSVQFWSLNSSLHLVKWRPLLFPKRYSTEPGFSQDGNLKVLSL